MLNAIANQLLPGETVLWSGVPATGIRLRKSDAYTIPFSILWAGFAIFWESAALVGRAPFFFKLWGIPFVAIGLYLTVGRFFVDARRHGRSAYAVTDQRILIVIGRDVTAFIRGRVSEIHHELHSDGRSTITFGPLQTQKGQPSSPAFAFISDGKTVMSLLGSPLPALR